MYQQVRLCLSIVCVCEVMLSMASLAGAHGLMNNPNQRGTLGGRENWVTRVVDKNAKTDYLGHFPAGSKNFRVRGAGGKSQVAAAGSKGWMPFEPLKKGFVWRAGVCGDLKPANKGPYSADTKAKMIEHMRGGEYYNGGIISATYRKGGVIGIGLSIVAHHNGFIEAHLCNVSKCGGEISESCFRQGHCQQLKRAKNNLCDSGRGRWCGPIDKKYPGRWYLPCTRYPLKNFKVESFDAKYILYRLPKHVTCEHCVLQWFWSTANSCNPPGVIDYFDGDDRPRTWGNCVGQGGARGGVARGQQPCSKNRFPEEYLQCADIRIRG